MRKMANSKSAGAGERKDSRRRFPGCARIFDRLSDCVKFLLAAQLLVVLIGGFTMRAYGASCWEARHIRNVYWNDLNTGHPGAAADLKGQNEWAFRNSCGPMDMHGFGDWDRDHHWRDSDWWFAHDRNWIQSHHPNWIADRAHYDNGHDLGAFHPEPQVHNERPMRNEGPMHNEGPVHNEGQGHDKNKGHDRDIH